MTTLLNLRPELTHYLQQRLHAFGEGFCHNLALIGPPGTGKTFQFQQLVANHPPNMTVIYCPLYRESCRSFLNRLLSSILQGGLPAQMGVVGPRPTPGGHEPTSGAVGTMNQPLEYLLQCAEPHLPKTVAAIQPIGSLLVRHLYGEAFNRALDTIPMIVEERRQPCVLMLDEFLFLEDLGFVHAFHELGKRVMTWPSALFLLASSSPFRARMILRERLHLLFGQFELLTLGRLDSTTTTAWVRQELRRVRGASVISPFLLHWLGAYPWYLTVFLKRLKEVTMLRKGSALIEPLFLQTAWDVLGAPEGTLHQWCQSRMEVLTHGRGGARAMEALIRVAEGIRTTTEIGKRIGRAGLSTALQLLVEHDLAQRNGMCWMVTDPILRCWLSTVLVMQRADAHVDSDHVRQRFEAYFRSLWTSWVQAHQLSLTEQVAGLFERFRDETVSLDSKTGRLPRFQTITTHHPDISGLGTCLIAEGEGRRWCAMAQEGAVDEGVISGFEAFCRTQTPKPSRKVVVTKAHLDQNAKLLAKTSNMWVWGSEDLSLLMGLYGQP